MDASAGRPVRVLLADAAPMQRSGLRMALTGTGPRPAAARATVPGGRGWETADERALGSGGGDPGGSAGDHPGSGGRHGAAGAGSGYRPDSYGGAGHAGRAGGGGRAGESQRGGHGLTDHDGTNPTGETHGVTDHDGGHGEAGPPRGPTGRGQSDSGYDGVGRIGDGPASGGHSGPSDGGYGGGALDGGGCHDREHTGSQHSGDPSLNSTDLNRRDGPHRDRQHTGIDPTGSQHNDSSLNSTDPDRRDGAHRDRQHTGTDPTDSQHNYDSSLDGRGGGCGFGGAGCHSGGGYAEILVAGEARDGVEAIDLARRLLPDVLITDLALPRVDGLAVTRAVAAAGLPVRVLILAEHDGEEQVLGAIAAGAVGFLRKDVPAAELLTAVRAVAAGGAVIAPPALGRVLARVAEALPRTDTTATSALDALTEREREVLVHVARGHSNAEIAGVLRVSETTIKTHVGHVLTKLRLRDRTQAVVLAYETGLIKPGG